MHKYRILLLILFWAFGSFVFAQNELKLEKVTVVSRHSVRTPLESNIATLNEITGEGNKWIQWTANYGELTPKGDSLERLFGAYFRLYLNDKQFAVESLSDEDVYFGASSKQRTVKTACAFASRMLPHVKVSVDYKKDSNKDYGYLDPDYLPLLNDFSLSKGEFNLNAFKAEAYRELGKLQTPPYAFLEEVIGMETSKYAKERGIKHFRDCVEVCLNFYKDKGERAEPTMVGGLRDANTASDAFILQYYEMEDEKAAAFGHDLSFEDWKKLAAIKDYYGYILFEKAPIISVNVSHCMLMRLQAEMLPNGHKFAFFCTHDSMIAALLAALRVKPYSLDSTIEVKTPIGGKLVFEQWTDQDKLNPEKYIQVFYVYQSSEQIRGIQMLDLSNPPMKYELSFDGIEKAPNGKYKYEDFMQHLQNSIQAYDATARGENPW